MQLKSRHKIQQAIHKRQILSKPYRVASFLTIAKKAIYTGQTSEFALLQG
jgi:hypothetical protein